MSRVGANTSIDFNGKRSQREGRSGKKVSSGVDKFAEVYAPGRLQGDWYKTITSGIAVKSKS